MKRYHNLGWFLTPVKGKVPVLSSWHIRPRQTEADLDEWQAKGYGVGVRTGHGFCVLDVDPGAAQEWFLISRYPHTPICRTPRGGLHVYLAAPDTLGNSAGKLAEHVDIRGKSGQAVIYEDWVVPPETPIAEMPTEWLETLLSAVTAEKKGMAALLRESKSVRQAAEGTRNDTLNRAAFNLGQLVKSGALDELTVRSELESAGLAVGLEHEEVLRTIESGMRGGAQKPRESRPTNKYAHLPQLVTNLPGQLPAPTKHVLIPGSHPTETGTVPVGTNGFADTVLRALDPGVLYRRESIVGIIVEGRFFPIGAQGMRAVIDSQLTLEMWKKVQGEPVKIFTPCTVDLAALILEVAARSKYVRNLRAIHPHPVVPPGRKRLRKGWHEEFGVLITDEPPEGTEPIDPADILTDFKMSKASYNNVIAMLCTCLCRSVLGGNAPAWFITASSERSGKTKLAQDVVGGIILGESPPMIQWPKNEDEVQKSILAYLISDHPILIVDNVPSRVESAAVASLITAERPSGRILGKTETIAPLNVLTLIFTGNHIELSSEIARRGGVIELEPGCADPELRTGFRHPDLRLSVAQQRYGIQEFCLRILETPGKPHAPLGGFERWNDHVGGSCHRAGYTPLLDRPARIVEMDNDRQDLKKILERIEIDRGDSWSMTADLIPYIQAAGAWPLCFRNANEHAIKVAVGAQLKKATGIVIGGRVLERNGTGSQRWYRVKRAT